LLKCSCTNEKYNKYDGYKSISNCFITDEIMYNTPDKLCRITDDKMHYTTFRKEEKEKKISLLVCAGFLK